MEINFLKTLDHTGHSGLLHLKSESERIRRHAVLQFSTLDVDR